MFERAIQLFDQYSKKVNLENTRLIETNAEIENKLNQIEWLIQSCRQLEARIEASAKNVPDVQAIYEIGVLAEAFYHFSFRLLDVLRKFHPKFKGFYSKSISEVRNHLVAHPEGKKQFAKISPSISYAFGTGHGPKIKTYNSSGGAVEDRGLFVNAKEFADELEKAFKIDSV